MAVRLFLLWKVMHMTTITGFIMGPEKAPGVPVGAYEGVFEGVTPGENEHGLNYKWAFKVSSGPHKGAVATRVTDRTVRPTTACGRMLIALAGRQIAEGESFDPSAVVGKPYMVVVEATKTGGTRVGTVAPR
jgi:hypothetical protein